MVLRFTCHAASFFLKCLDLESVESFQATRCQHDPVRLLFVQADAM